MTRSLTTSLILFLFAVIFPNNGTSQPETWKEYKSGHFIIFYHPLIPAKHITRFASRCEKYYKTITHRLGFSRFNFWLWEDRARIFMYKSRDNYLETSGRAAWSGSSVQVRKKEINTFYFDRIFFDVILPHELSHIILREFIGFDTRAPLWFDEGVACSNEENSLERYFFVARKLFQKGKQKTVVELNQVVSPEAIVPEIFYPMSAALVNFFLDSYGEKRFVDFCKELRDGNPFFESIAKIYNIKTTADLDEKFAAYIRAV